MKKREEMGDGRWEIAIADRWMSGWIDGGAFTSYCRRYSGRFGYVLGVGCELETRMVEFF